MGVDHLDSDIIPDTNRLVWVINKLQPAKGYDESLYWYKERFRSDLISIPPCGKKRVMMRFLAAQKFIGQTVAPAEPFPNGGFVHPETGEVESHRFGKPLEILEFTAEEREKYDGMTPAQAMERVKEIELELSGKSHVPEGKTDAVAVGTGKPQAQGTRRRRLPSSSEMSDDIQRIDGN